MATSVAVVCGRDEARTLGCSLSPLFLSDSEEKIVMTVKDLVRCHGGDHREVDRSRTYQARPQAFIPASALQSLDP
jgi:hypothetical protein